MNRIIRSPWLWLTAAVLGVLVVLQFFMPNGGYEEVQTSTMVKHLRDGEIKSMTFVDGGDQQIKAELDNGDKVIAT
ncbi:MAG: cell division protein FtsH, partial [Alphaproteobacteria bacterium]